MPILSALGGLASPVQSQNLRASSGVLATPTASLLSMSINKLSFHHVAVFIDKGVKHEFKGRAVTRMGSDLLLPSGARSDDVTSCF